MIENNQQSSNIFILTQKKPAARQVFFILTFYYDTTGSIGTINNATILIILINGLIAGPAVSL